MPAALTPVLIGVVAYAYVGYPLAVIALSRLHPEEGRHESAEPQMTIVVPAFNEEAVIGTKVAGLLARDYPSDRMEIVVVTDGSSDGTAAAARLAGGTRVTVLDDPVRQGKAAAMRRGVAAASGEIVVFTDANNYCSPSALAALLAPFADPEVGAVSGAKTVIGGPGTSSSGERLYWSYESAIKMAESRLGFCTAAIGEFLAIRRDLVPDFPVGLVNDDFYIAMQVARQGWRLAYAPDAVSVEPPSASEGDEAVRRRRIAAGRWQALTWWRRTLPLSRPLVVWQVASHKYLRLVLPFAMGGALASTVVDVAVRRRPATVAALGIQVGFYGLAAMGPTAPGPRPVRQAAAAARYIVSSNIAVALGLADDVRDPPRLHLWKRADRAVEAIVTPLEEIAS